MATIITVHMRRKGRIGVSWQVGMSAIDTVQTQATAARIARLPATGVATSDIRARKPDPLRDPGEKKKPGGSRLPARGKRDRCYLRNEEGAREGPVGSVGHAAVENLRVDLLPRRD